MSMWVLSSLAVPLALSAAGSPELSLSERAAQSDRVALVRVLETSVQVPDGDPARMVTLTRLQVEQDLKGTGLKTVELVQLGGTYGAWERKIPEETKFAAAERAVVFLRCRNPERKDRCVLAGRGAAKLTVVPGVEPEQVRIVTRAGEQRTAVTAIAAQLSKPGAPIAPKAVETQEAGSTGGSPKVSR